MYRCESWNAKDAELWRNNDALLNSGTEKTLESPLDCKIKPVNPNILINPEYSLEGLMLKLKI